VVISLIVTFAGGWSPSKAERSHDQYRADQVSPKECISIS
jgi:hypothetical protein